MQIDCYLSPECGSEDALRENIYRALAIERIEAEVKFHKTTAERAQAMGLTGSPAVFIDGKQLQPQDSTGFS